MRLKRIMLAASKSGSGKTTITCALLELLKKKGEQMVSYKCGPDYIDPMFHEEVLHIPSKNLDTFFTDEEQTRALFIKDRSEKEFAVIEGVMGLFDGLSGIYEEGSSYHLAKITKTPIILVVDAKGMGRSLLPLIAGFLSYDTEKLIKGVFLNRMSKGFYQMIGPLIEKELGIDVVGYLPDQKEMTLKSRHLGLVMPGELVDIHTGLQQLAKKLDETLDTDKIMKIAESACEIETTDVAACSNICKTETFDHASEFNDKNGMTESKPVIGVARDEAFCFYYKDNLDMLEEMGASLAFFSPLHDKEIPKTCDALLLGGGYPELFAEKLQANISMRASIRNAFTRGMPVVAECGGFMYLHDKLTDQNGNTYEMVGALPGTCAFQGKLVRFGYIQVQEKESNFLSPGKSIKGHEFHYYDSTDNGCACVATKPGTKRSYDCVLDQDDLFLGFPHLYYPSNPEFARSFVEKAENYKKS